MEPFDHRGTHGCPYHGRKHPPIPPCWDAMAHVCTLLNWLSHDPWPPPCTTYGTVTVRKQQGPPAPSVLTMPGGEDASDAASATSLDDCLCIPVSGERGGPAPAESIQGRRTYMFSSHNDPKRVHNGR